MLKEDSRRSRMSRVPAWMPKGRGDGFGLSMAEIARHVGVTTSGIAKTVARLEEEG
jgi:DNA-binding MarR family transcriptional regulator